MPPILDLVASSKEFFTPSNPREYIGLQLARRLNDVQEFRHYLVLFEHYPPELILRAYRECRSRGNSNKEGFLNAFRQLTFQDDDK